MACLRTVMELSSSYGHMAAKRVPIASPLLRAQGASGGSGMLFAQYSGTDQLLGNPMRETLSASATVTAAAMTFGACASKPPAEPAIASATASVDAARASGTSELAAVELNSARSKLDCARSLAPSGDARAASRLAEKADVEAQLARAKAGSERSRWAVAELDASLQTLCEELAGRPAGAPVSAPLPVR